MPGTVQSLMITPYGTDDCLFSTGDAATNASRERKRAFGVIILRKTKVGISNFRETIVVQSDCEYKRETGKEKSNPTPKTRLIGS